MFNRFLVGNILREVRNGRLNCNSAMNEQFKSNTDNTTYVKKIRKGKKVFPYASAQNQKKIIKKYAESQGLTLSNVMSVSTKEAKTEGNPAKNYDEDVMGFLVTGKAKISKEEYDALDDEDKKKFKKQKGKYVEKEDKTKKRRSNLMLSPLQAIGHTRIIDEFCVRQTNANPLPYTKQVYATEMSSGFCMDIDKIGKFKASSVASDYRDYDIKEVDTEKFELDKDEKLKRINVTLDGLRLLNSNITMTNNLEDLSAKFIIMAEYSIGNAVFNNIFEDNKLKIDYLKQAIEENEKYRISKIYIGVRNEFFKQDGKYLIDIIKEEFGEDDRFVIGGVKEVIDKYKEYLTQTL